MTIKIRNTRTVCRGKKNLSRSEIRVTDNIPSNTNQEKIGENCNNSIKKSKVWIVCREVNVTKNDVRSAWRSGFSCCISRRWYGGFRIKYTISLRFLLMHSYLKWYSCCLPHDMHDNGVVLVVLRVGGGGVCVCWWKACGVHWRGRWQVGKGWCLAGAEHVRLFTWLTEQENGLREKCLLNTT